MANEKNEGETVAEAGTPRVKFLREVLLRAGIRDEVVDSLCEDLYERVEPLDRMVDDLIEFGVSVPPGEAHERVTLGEFEGLSYPPSFITALERKRLTANGAEQWSRLGRLFGYGGERERSALCYRTSFVQQRELPPQVLADIAETVDPTVNLPLGLACIDRLAEIILTGDEFLDSPNRQDLMAEDPAGCALLLDRARRAALRINEPGRAVALGRAATALFERCGLRHKLQLALDGLANALIANEDLAGAAKVIERRRVVLAAESDYQSVAECHRQRAQLCEQLGDIDGAIERYDREIDVYETLGDGCRAASAGRHLGDLYLRSGKLDDAVDSYDRAREMADGSPADVALSRVALSLAWEALGNFGTALTETRAAIAGFRSEEEFALSAHALVNMAILCLDLNDTQAAGNALAEARQEDWSATRLPALRRAEALVKWHEGNSADAARGLEAAYQLAAELGDEPEAAKALLALGDVVYGKDDGLQPWIIEEIGQLENCTDDLLLRLEVLAQRLAENVDGLQSCFDRAALSEFVGVRIDAALALAEILVKKGRARRAHRPIASTLRVLGDLASRLPSQFNASFCKHPTVERARKVAGEIRAIFSEGEGSSESDEDATAQLSPLDMLDGLLAALSPLDASSLGATSSEENGSANEGDAA